MLCAGKSGSLGRCKISSTQRGYLPAAAKGTPVQYFVHSIGDRSQLCCSHLIVRKNAPGIGRSHTCTCRRIGMVQSAKLHVHISRTMKHHRQFMGRPPCRQCQEKMRNGYGSKSCMAADGGMVRTVPEHCPNSARTVPEQCPNSARTVPNCKITMFSRFQ